MTPTGTTEPPSFIDLDSVSVQQHHLCCALSGKKHVDGVACKRSFLDRGFGRGLRFRKLDVRGKVFVEYAPAEAAFRPVHAPGCLVIHCLWVSGRFKGQGHAATLLQGCITDLDGRPGLVAISGNKVWLTRTAFYLHHGFEVVDTTPTGFDLVYYRKDRRAPLTRFAERARRGVVEQGDGVHIEYAHQCPIVPNAVGEMSRAAEDLGLSVSTAELRTPEQAQRAASPFGTFGVFLDGRFLTHGMMSRESFRRRLEEALAGDAPAV